MSALTTARTVREKKIKDLLMPLAAGEKAFKGGRACINTATGTVVAGQAGTALIPVGLFAETYDNSAGGSSVSVNVSFDEEITLRYFDADAGDAPTAADVGSDCYILDDHTVTMTSSGNSVAGRVMLVDSQVGVRILSGNPITQPEAGAIHDPVATLTALKAIPAGSRADGMLVLNLADGSLWKFSAASTAADTSENMVAVPAAGTGRWLRANSSVDLSLPFTSATADAAVLFTVPVGCRLKVREAYFDIAVTMAGGSSSAIGASSSVAGFSTKGDLLGGAGGDVAATLVSTNAREVGTVGATLTSTARLIMLAADTIKFDRITSAFTSGSGKVRVLCDVIQNLGA